jgi:hypothetical protein
MVSAKTPPAPGDPLYPMPPSLAPLDAVRGSILVLDWRWLRENALFEAYDKALAERSLLAAAASDWVPIDAALGHWDALEALALPSTSIAEIGHFVGAHVHGAFLRTLVQLAGQLGTSPWAALKQTQKLWERSWRGGGVAIHRTGSSSAQIAVVKAAVARSPFFRGSFRGAVAEGIAPLCQRPLIVELEEARTPMSFTLRASWV